MSKTLKVILSLFGVTIILSAAIYFLVWWFYIKPIYSVKKIPVEKTGEHIKVERFLDINQVVDPSSASLQSLFESVSEEVGFHVYYPTFVPVGLELDKTSILWDSNEQEKVLANYNLRDINSQSPWIAIVMMKTGENKENSILRRADTLKSVKEISTFHRISW